MVLIAAASAISYNIKTVPEEITEENFERIGKVLNGVDGKKGENLDFCYMKIGFFQKTQTCGCLIVTPNYVATSARCVYE